jgi:hypothetical protein
VLYYNNNNNNNKKKKKKKKKRKNKKTDKVCKTTKIRTSEFLVFNPQSLHPSCSHSILYNLTALFMQEKVA